MTRASVLDCPAKITGEITKFCQTFTAQPPQIMKAVPFPGCDGPSWDVLPGHIERFGGQAVAGWRIIIWPRVLLLAEPHMVWLSPKQEWIDVCPAHNRGGHSLFVASDMAQATSLPHHQMALAKDGDILAWTQSVQSPESDMNGSMDLFLRLFRRYARPADPCWCGSGRQWRKCHKGQ